MNQQPILETERLLLRPFSLSDAADVQRLAGDFAIADTTQTIPHPYEGGVAEQWISNLAERFAQGKVATFAVVLKPQGTLIGAISLMEIEKGHQAGVGYWIGKPYWNQGFCTEAGRAILRYGFEAWGLNRIHSCHFSRNPASGQVMRKIGMQHEGRRIQHGRKWDKFEDMELYGILKAEWQEQQSTRSV